MTAASPIAPRPAPSLLPLLLLTLAIGLAGGWSLSALVYPGNGFSTTRAQPGPEQVSARP
jgi:hypothetical protein